MAWPAVAMVGIAALGMITDFIGGASAKKAAARAAEKEAIAEGKVTAERVRQLEVEERTMAGQTRAGYAGGGVKASKGSPLAILAEQAKEFAHEKQITRQVGATKAAAALQQGRDVGNAARYQSYSNLAKGASNIFSIVAQAKASGAHFGKNVGPG